MRKMQFLLLALVWVIPICAFAQSSAIEAGMEWKKYENIAPAEKAELLSVNKRLPDFIDDGQGLFYIHTDVTKDGNDDFVLYFANPDDCGVDGCLYVVVDVDNKSMKPYTAFSFKLSKEGLMIDNELVEQ
jgi:hypothetical protein